MERKGSLTVLLRKERSSPLVSDCRSFLPTQHQVKLLRLEHQPVGRQSSLRRQGARFKPPVLEERGRLNPEA